jgi:hypothetical protein
VDVEGSELKSIPEWISSGVLSQVDQIGIEIHTGFIKQEESVKELSGLLDLIRKLYNIGFRLISTSNNECMAKTNDFEHKFFSLMEVVFYKEQYEV